MHRSLPLPLGLRVQGPAWSIYSFPVPSSAPRESSPEAPAGAAWAALNVCVRDFIFWRLWRVGLWRLGRSIAPAKIVCRPSSVYAEALACFSLGIVRSWFNIIDCVPLALLSHSFPPDFFFFFHTKKQSGIQLSFTSHALFCLRLCSFERFAVQNTSEGSLRSSIIKGSFAHYTFHEKRLLARFSQGHVQSYVSRSIVFRDSIPISVSSGHSSCVGMSMGLT